MNKKRLIWLVVPAILFVSAACGPLKEAAPADLVIKNAKVVTIDKDNSRAEAVAFKGEHIVAVTTDKKIDRFIDEEITRVIDAKGRLVVPGFNDAHVHFGGIEEFNAIFAMTACDKGFNQLGLIGDHVMESLNHDRSSETGLGKNKRYNNCVCYHKIS